jgi:dienelactone hydrolase
MYVPVFASRLRAAFLVALVSLLGCTTPTLESDAAIAIDAGNDAAVMLPACEVSLPLVAGTPETDAIANAPARCGMPAYAWLDDPSLGSVVSRTRSGVFSARTLGDLVTAAGVLLPRPVVYDVQIDTIAYVTQDRGRLVQSSAALAYPTSVTDRATLPTILIAHGTSGWAPHCGPSVEVNFHTLSAVFAGLGYVVVAPDFFGLESAGTPYGAPPPYLVGEPTAIASLDAVRAGLRAVSDLRIPACGSNDLVVWGGSQGGHAALWIDRLAPYYARELHLRGVVAAIPAADIVAHTEHAFSSVVDTTSFFAAMMATAPSWYGLGDRLSDIFVAPNDVNLPVALAASCDPPIPVSPLDGLLTPAIRDAATAGTLGTLDPWGCILSESSLLATRVPRLSTASDPSYGMLFIAGENDTILTASIQRSSFDTLCADAVPVHYLECQGAGHTDAAFWSIGETLDFLEARIRGDVFTPDCARVGPVRCSETPP